MEYSYITSDNLENTQNYMYTPYGGEAFLQAYLKSRNKYLYRDVSASAALQKMIGETRLQQDETFKELLALWNTPRWTERTCKEKIDQYVKRFEVRKHLFGAYDGATKKPILETGYQEIDRYLFLAAIAERAYRVFGSLKYLNCLLKLNDTLLSLMPKLNQTQHMLVCGLLASEVDHVQEIGWRKRIALFKNRNEANKYEAVLSEIACVLADTARSQAYLQALVRSGLKPAECLILADSRQDMREPAGASSGERQYFNINEPLLETLEQNQIKYEFLGTRDINADAVEKALRGIPQRYLIYSGYGGYILRPHLFRLGKKWIHVHAGTLPDYRGSTTAYYSMLDHGRIGATAIFLNEKIDEGHIIAEREFLPPADRELIDYIYEPYVRSCVLVDALRMYQKSGEFYEKEQEPPADRAEIYYIIHPVLKHIAILGQYENNDT